MTACSLLRLLILTQPSKLIFFISGQLATNCLGLVAKGFFWHQNIFIPFISINQKQGKQKISVGDCIEYFLLYHRWRHLER